MGGAGTGVALWVGIDIAPWALLSLVTVALAFTEEPVVAVAVALAVAELVAVVLAIAGREGVGAA